MVKERHKSIHGIPDKIDPSQSKFLTVSLVIDKVEMFHKHMRWGQIPHAVCPIFLFSHSHAVWKVVHAGPVIERHWEPIEPAECLDDVPESGRATLAVLVEDQDLRFQSFLKLHSLGLLDKWNVFGEPVCEEVLLVRVKFGKVESSLDGMVAL